MKDLVRPDEAITLKARDWVKRSNTSVPTDGASIRRTIRGRRSAGPLVGQGQYRAVPNLVVSAAKPVTAAQVRRALSAQVEILKTMAVKTQNPASAQATAGLAGRLEPADPDRWPARAACRGWRVPAQDRDQGGLGVDQVAVERRGLHGLFLAFRTRAPRFWRTRSRDTVPAASSSKVEGSSFRRSVRMVGAHVRPTRRMASSSRPHAQGLLLAFSHRRLLADRGLVSQPVLPLHVAIGAHGASSEASPARRRFIEIRLRSLQRPVSRRRPRAGRPPGRRRSGSSPYAD